MPMLMAAPLAGDAAVVLVDAVVVLVDAVVDAVLGVVLGVLVLAAEVVGVAAGLDCELDELEPQAASSDVAATAASTASARRG